MEWMLMPYRRYAEFSGRSRRREYWMFALFYWLVSMALLIVFGNPVMSMLGMPGGGMFAANLAMGMTGGVVRGLFGLFSLIPSLAVQVRRLHDIDRSGWWLLLWFVPFLGWLVLLVFMCLDGTYGSNRYGMDPKGRGTADVFR